MTRKLTFLILALFALCLNFTWASPGDEITSVANIVSGKTYFIKGVRKAGTFYLTFSDTQGSQSGTEASSTSSAVAITFTKVSEGVYNLTTPNGYYIAAGTSNGKINVSENAINVTATDNDSKIRLTITSGNTEWSIQKNTSAPNFGGYKNTQNDITLIEAGSASAYTVTYDANGGNDEPDAQEADDDNKVTITTDRPTYEGYSFTGWNTKADGTGESYEAGQEYTLTSNIKLYAQWSINSYTITLNVNGHTSDITVAGNETILSKISSTPQIAGLTFKGWSYSNDTNNISYVGENDKPTENKIIYAVFSTTIEGSRPAYAIVSSTGELSDGDKIVIVGIKNESNYAAKAYVSGNNVKCATVTMDDNDNYIVSLGEAAEYTLGRTDDVYTLFDGTYYLYAAGGTGANNYLKGAGNAGNDNAKWSISITNNKATIKTKDNTVARHTIRFNTNGSNDPLFSCYESGQTDIYLYKKTEIPGNQEILFTTIQELSGEITTSANHDNATVVGATTIKNGATLTISGMLINTTASNLIIEDGAQLIHSSENVMATVKKSIKGYSYEASKDGYYLIANPTDESYIVNLTSNNYDLYAFDAAQEDEWRNAKVENFEVERGTGYLYANSSDVTLEFAGELTPAGSSNIELTYANAGEGIDFPGFNLIGNPFACNAYPTDGYGNFMSYYKMNGTGSELTLVEDVEAIAPCEGFFVEANADGDKVTISTTAPEAQAKMMSLNVSNESNVGTIDRAIVNFDGRNNLHKFMLNPDHTNISLAMNGEEFAAVSTSSTSSELPVNFKAEKNGTYTITVNTENIDAEYLHLIDNMTGMDIDVLATPSYTFEAKTSDYASRFKLVFNVNNAASANSDSNFAYISDGNLVISDIEGEATLQIIDMMGRVVSTETVSGNFNKALNLRAGAYVLNLNGMTQKIVVE